MEFFHPHGGGEQEIRLSISYLTPPQVEEGVQRLTRFVEVLSHETYDDEKHDDETHGTAAHDDRAHDGEALSTGTESDAR